jgi:hypothetical protein
MKKESTKPQTESQIQKDCVAWFRRRYESIEPLFFSVANGGARNAWTAKIMKDEGVRAGVADLILLIPRHGFAGLLVEMKTPDGKQSDSQKEFERLATQYRYKYVVVRDLTTFQQLMLWYIEDKAEEPICI